MDNQNLNNNIHSTASIFNEYGDFIHRIAFHITCDQETADDLFQNFFLHVIINPIPQNVKNIRSYIYKALLNDNADRIRKLKSRQELFEIFLKKTNFSINVLPSHNALNTEQWFSKFFKEIGGHLSPSELESIRLRYKDGLDVEQVAEKMRVKKESVSRYISVGLIKIREFFEKRGNFDELF